MDNFKRNQISELTTAILELYEIDTPIENIEDVVKKLGGSIKYNRCLGEYSDGKVRKDGESFVIEVPENQSPARKNFTIAHELGHLFLHMGYKIDKDCWNASDGLEFNRKGNSEFEFQANEFAAAFLMPKSKYIKVMYENLDGDAVNIGEIARYFNVSVDAATYRGKWLGYLQW